MSILRLYKQLKAFISAEKAFFKNVSFVFGGKVYISVLSLALTPIIARLFTPEDYGEFALYNTVAQNLVVIGTLSLPLAITTSKKSELTKIVNLCITIIILFFIIFSLGFSLFNSQLDIVFSTTIFSNYWPLLLVSILLFSINKTLTSLNVRLKRFSLNTKINMSETTAAKISNLLGGWAQLGAFGFMISDILSKIINFVSLIAKFPLTTYPRLLSLKEIRALIIQFKKFPAYSMPSAWLGTISNQFTILLIAFLYDKNVLGQLSMAIALLGIPLNVLSNSFQPVITQRLVTILDGEYSHRFFDKMLFILLGLSGIIFLTIYFIPENVFALFLGSKWVGIKGIINIYVWYYIILFVDQALQNGFIIYNKQKLKLFFNIIELALLLLVSSIAITNQMAFENLLLLIILSKMTISGSRVFYLWKQAVNF